MGRRAEARALLDRHALAVLEKDGHLPLAQDVAAKAGVSVSTAYRRLDQLARENGVPAPRLLPRLSPQRRAEVVKAVENGDPVAQIALRFGVGENTVRRTAAASGVVPAPRQKARQDQPPTPARRKPSTREVIKDYLRHQPHDSHLTHRQIASALGLSVSTVSYHLPRIRDDITQGRVEASTYPPRDQRFVDNCRALAEAVARGKGIPQAQRVNVMTMCLPVLRPTKHIDSPYLVLAVPAAVAYHYARSGRSATLFNIAALLPRHSKQALREAALRCVSMQTLDKAGEGFLPVGADPMFVPALALKKMGSADWSPSLLRMRDEVIAAVLRDHPLADTTS